MENNKGTFVLKSDLIHVVSQLPNEKAGQLFKNILAFVNIGVTIIDADDLILNLVFEPIKQELLNNCEKDKSFKEKCSQAGKKSAQLKKIQKPKSVNTPQGTLRSVKVPQGTLNLDYQEIIDIFNTVCADLPTASLTEERIKLIDKILKTYSLEQIGDVFRNTKESDYLNGKKNGWRANLNWLLNPNNFIKVLEGNYKTLNPESESASSKNQLSQAKSAVNKYFHQ